MNDAPKIPQRNDAPGNADALRAAMFEAEVALIELMRNRKALRSLATSRDAGSPPEAGRDAKAA